MKTILVVDDQAICREPMAAMLRLQGYQTLEAANGSEALQIALTLYPDLILLDVTMPVMDGLACLAQLRSSPATAKIPVIMLTATLERQVVIDAAQKGITGFLLKSHFSTAELISKVQSTIGVPEAATTRQPPALGNAPAPHTASDSANAEPRVVSDNRPTPAPAKRPTKPEILQRLTQEIELRSITPVLEYVIALTRSSTSTLDDVAGAIRQDQALALRVLRVANSSLYQRGRGAKNVMEATQRIGLTAVRNAVIAILTIDHFEVATESGLIPQRFWEHSLATGVLAEMIGEAVSAAQTEHLFLAGLLHDVGRMVLSTIYPREYAAVLNKAAEQDLDLASAEQSAFALSHSDVTQLLLSKWNMPSFIVQAASLHESPFSELNNVKQNAQSILAVALANRLAHALLAGSSGNGRLLPYHEFASALGLEPETIDRIAFSAVQKMTDTEMFYAAQSSQHFCDPLAIELAKKAKLAPRLAVLGPDAPADPFSLFFNQLGWLESEQPTAALIFARTPLDFTRYLPALKKLDVARRRNLSVIVATTAEATRVPAEWSYGRQIETIALPCGYSRLIDAVIRCTPAVAPGATTATGR